MKEGQYLICVICHLGVCTKDQLLADVITVDL